MIDEFSGRLLCMDEPAGLIWQGGISRKVVLFFQCSP